MRKQTSLFGLTDLTQRMLRIPPKASPNAQ
ncbi:MAG: hypothetical protein JWO36_1120 [Myxococcales bacterium]|nr:hypothetical protein [Myxococcales bacterium]